MNDTSAPLRQLAAIRREFPGADKWIYFETSARGLMPLGARDAVARYLDDRIYEGGAKATMLDVLERVRGKFARLIGAAPDEVAIVKNVSEGINAIVTSLPWKQGENAVLCADIEHPNSTYALYNMRDRHGIEVRTVPATADFATPVEAIAKTMDDKTRMVIASTVTYTTGARTDLDTLAGLCRARDILLLVDGAQSVGALELDMRATPLDAMTVGASKYLCGPYGCGFLYVRRERAERFSHVVLVGKPDPDAALQTQLQKIYDHLAANRVKMSMRHGRLRFAFHFYNTLEEVEKVLSLIQAGMASRP